MKAGFKFSPPSAALRVALVAVCIWCIGAARGSTWQTGFDTADSVVWWWIPPVGSPTPTAGWDSTQDVAGNPASGSLKFSAEFSGRQTEYCTIYPRLLDTSNQWLVLDGTIYVHLYFDLKVANETAPATAGGYGQLGIGFISTNWSHWDVGGLGNSVQIPLSATNWTRFNLPIFPATSDLDSICGMKLGLVSTTNSWTRSPNTVTLNFDNFGLYTVCCPPPSRLLLSIARRPGTDLILRWPVGWPAVYLQASADLVEWHDTGLETNKVSAGNAWEVAITADVLPSPTGGYWRLRYVQP